jgi:hypothetical protein
VEITWHLVAGAVAPPRLCCFFLAKAFAVAGLLLLLSVKKGEFE